MIFQMQVQGVAGPAGRQQIAIEAPSEAEAVRAAVRNGWRVLAIDRPASLPQKGGRQSFPLLQFSQELLALLEAGLNLTEAIATLHSKEQRPGVRGTIGDILQTLQQGKSLSETLASLPAIFPEIYVATVHAAERSGNLPDALGRFVAYQLQFDAIRKKLVSAAIYPAMLLVVGALVTLFLLGYVVPRFSVVYESSGRSIPWMSQLLLGFGQGIASHPLVFLTVLVAAAAGTVFVLAHAPTRARLGQALLRLPVLADKAAEFRLARFYRALSLLLHAGIPLSKALAMVSSMLLQDQQQQLQAARRAIQEGLPFSTALETHRLATPVARSLLKVGENTGRLDDMLERSARFHDEEFARWIDWASRLLEPVLMTVIGVVIGGVVVLMYMPIFELAGSLS